MAVAVTVVPSIVPAVAAISAVAAPMTTASVTTAVAVKPRGSSPKEDDQKAHRRNEELAAKIARSLQRKKEERRGSEANGSRFLAGRDREGTSEDGLPHTEPLDSKPHTGAVYREFVRSLP